MTCVVGGANRDRPGTAQRRGGGGGGGGASFAITVVCNMLIAHMDHVDASVNIHTRDIKRHSNVHVRKPKYQ